MKQKKRRCFPPCPAYDMEAMESWLRDMAKEGWLLEKDNALFGYFVFRKAQPQSVHYRLDAVTKRQSIWTDEDPRRPGPDALALSEEFGWEFVFKYQEFYIYRSFQSQPRELHTDPEIQAMTLKLLNRRVVSSLLWALFLILMQVCFGVYGYPFSIAMAMGSLFWVCFTAVIFAQILSHLIFISRIQCIRRTLLAGQPLNPEKNWRKGARSYRLRQGISLVLTIFTIATTVFAKVRSENETLLPDFTGDPPFVVLEDLSPEGAKLDKIDNGHCKFWSDPLFPQVWEWLDGGGVIYEDGTETGGLLEIQYCETASPWLALGAARDFTRFYRFSATLWGSDVEVKPLEGYELDYAVGLYNQFGLIQVVLAEGDRAICCRLSMDDGAKGNFTIENWTDKMARNLLKNQEE